MGKSTFYKDFKAFISKGNVIDLAVAVVIGASFNKIVSSLVDDIIMPLISLAAGGLNVTDWKWIIKEAALDAQGNVIQAETALRYGKFMQNVLDFLIIAFSIFIVLRSFTKLQDYKKKAIEKISSDEDEK
ncbi:MAG: large conductance mechanosensitive channel protein MscL [Eubacteriales bacterium]